MIAGILNFSDLTKYSRGNMKHKGIKAENSLSIDM